MKMSFIKTLIVPIIISCCICACSGEHDTYYEHHITGRFYVDVMNTDINNGQMYVGSGVLQPVKAHNAKVYDTHTYTSMILTQNPMWIDYALDKYIDNDGFFTITTEGVNSAIRIQALYAIPDQTDPNISDMVYSVDTVIRYKNAKSYEDLEIILLPEHYFVQVSPNPLKATDKTYTLAFCRGSYSQLTLKYKDKATNAVVEEWGKEYETRGHNFEVPAPRLLEHNKAYTLEIIAVRTWGTENIEPETQVYRFDFGVVD